jgi:multiple sugar transport system ATP-binding protein
MVQIKVCGVSKSFGGLEVFKDLSLSIMDKSYVCLLGPSGCGKTTLMRIISGLEDISAGAIYFNDTRVDAKNCAERDVGIAFQNYALYPNLTVEGNLRSPLRAPIRRNKYSEADIRSRVDEIANLLEITPYLHRTTDQLSGGQQQRVSLGRALIRRPKVLLLDEPITHLDARLRYSMRSELKRIHEVMGTTTIHVTHDQQEALAMADQLILMRDGKIEQADQPMEIYHHPENSFVAGFLGDPQRSLITLTIVSGEDGPVAQLGEVSFPLPTGFVKAYPELVGKNILTSIPAKAINYQDKCNAIIGIVKAHEMVAGGQRIILDVNGQRFNTHTKEVRHVTNGDRIGISLDLEPAHFFDVSTGRVLSRGDA